jgi:hypothetical protein
MKELAKKKLEEVTLKEQEAWAKIQKFEESNEWKDAKKTRDGLLAKWAELSALKRALESIV